MVDHLLRGTAPAASKGGAGAAESTGLGEGWTVRCCAATRTGEGRLPATVLPATADAGSADGCEALSEPAPAY
jgi:hypothetical protein